MKNGDRVRTFSNEQLALTLMCPREAMLDEFTCPKETQKTSCVKCLYAWLEREEAL